MAHIKNLALIDDDDVFVFLTTKTVNKTSLVEQVINFDNGLDALDFITENRYNGNELPEMILLDLSMPIMDGWQFLDEFIKLKPSISKPIAIYICTSSISPDDVALAKSISEVTDFIVKPVTTDKLVEMIERL